MTPTAPQSPPLLEFRDVRKSFFGVPVLRGIGLPIRSGRILGLVGENGAGKSTLMNLLGGVVPPDGGAMLLDGQPYAPRRPRDATRSGVAFIHQELNLFPNLSIAENLQLDALPLRRLAGLPLPIVDRSSLRHTARQLLNEVDLPSDPDTPVGALPPGPRQLVEIARALGARARLLILDEPTTSLSAADAARLFSLLRRLRDDRGVAPIFISHNLPDVLALCDDLAVLRDGQLVSHGPASSYDEPRLIREMVGPPVAAPPVGWAPPAIPQGSKSPGGPGSPEPGSRSDKSYQSTGLPDQGPPASAPPLLALHNVSRPPFVRDASLTLRAGEILGLAGLMGAGRTELARLIFGLDPITSGSVAVDGRPFDPSPRRGLRAGMAFLTEDRRAEGLLLDAAVVPNAALATVPAYTRTPLRLVESSRLRTAVAAVADRVRLRAAGLDRQPVRTLSGGNQQKVILARWLLTRPRILLLDEPTRGIDVGARQDIYALITDLAAAGAGILLISSEIEELMALCDRIIVMSGGRLLESLSRPDFDRERILRLALQRPDRQEPRP